ncbi:MAG: PDZ domain-containing protein [Holophagales bacterium]|nr:PDZ domain-containing protein [Holophagales bacterium]MYF95620.1 PDZ domain-containing protein [Holophagales bacterium]
MSRVKLWLVVGLALAVVAPAVALDDEEKKVRRIEVKKIKAAVDCEGDDCPEAVSRVLFVGDDGDVRVLHGDDNEWVAEDNVRTLEADDHDVVLIEAHEADGHDVVLIEAHEVDGETGESARRHLHRVMQRLGERGSRLHLRHGGGAFLGVQLSDLTPELRTHFGVPEDAGVMVGKLVDGSPAFRAGLEVGDIVTAVDGEPVASAAALAGAIRGHEDGNTVVLEVWRDGRMQKISATLEERERRVEMSSAVSAAADGQSEARVIEVKVDCEDGEDCTVDVENANSFEFAAAACGDSGECEVSVDCTGGDCACTVNGEAADCSELGL